MVPVQAEDLDEARVLLFSRHPAMEEWHAHKFTVYVPLPLWVSAYHVAIALLL